MPVYEITFRRVRQTQETATVDLQADDDDDINEKARRYAARRVSMDALKEWKNGHPVIMSHEVAAIRRKP